jgi:hypothetical protein
MGDNPTKALELTPKAKQLADQVVAEAQSLLTSYRDINRAAIKGEAINGASFTEPEERFGNGSVREADAFTARNSRFQPAFDAYLNAGMKRASEKNPSLLSEANATASINKTFVSRYVKNAKRENTKLSPRARTEQNLIEETLANNDGFALGEAHSQSEALDFLARNMKFMKLRRVDTIYSEYPQFNMWKDLNATQLRNLAKFGSSGGFKINSAKETAKFYLKPEADPVEAKLALMMAEARKYGIRLVYIDKKIGGGKQLETKQHRVASTNFVWTDNQQADRLALAEQDYPPGKSVFLAGLDHFIIHPYRYTKNEKEIIITRKGFVDEALGFPLFAFERADKKGPSFRRGDNPNGPDYYLPGGMNYPDTVAMVQKEPEPLLADIQAPVTPHRKQNTEKKR